MEITNKKVIEKKFNVYKSLKKDEFSLKNGERADSFVASEKEKKKIIEKIVTNRVCLEDGSFETKDFTYSIFEDDLIEKMNPDNIDSSYFWKKAIKTFPLHSIVSSAGCKTVAEVNETSIEYIHRPCGALDILDKIYSENPNAKVLEIGPGYGSITNYIALNHNLKKYYAIDVNPLFKFKRLYKTDGKTIVDKVPNELDAVYSVNVFQHLSPEQRMSYYKQIKEKLVPGGKFVFSMFVVDSETEKIVFDNGAFLFGLRDKRGNCYTNFFSQLTKCNRIEEIEEIFRELDMEFEIININFNHYTMCVTKR